MKATTFLSVRMTESENRRVKVLAARLGLSLQDVVRQALDAWVLEHDPQARRRHQPQAGTLAATDGQRRKREATRQVPLDKLRAGSRPLRRPPAADGLVTRDDRLVQGSGVRSAPHVSAAGRGAARATAPAPGERPRNLDWLRDAERLDWSQCRVVKVRATQAGRIWFFRGTHVALPAVLHDFRNGCSLREVLARHAGLTAEQAKAAVEFAYRTLLHKKNA
jgi:uncharacterized protein (DUF433 family)